MSYCSGCAERDAEIVRVKEWVNDLQSGLFINCVYCGHRYGPAESTAATIPEAATRNMAEALREHVESCPKHPMSALKAKLAASEAARNQWRAWAIEQGYHAHEPEHNEPPLACGNCCALLAAEPGPEGT